MKVIAFYLPQFHEIPENNIWWGKGFTEWTNVKKSTPLFPGHYQPRVPLDECYYDLSDYRVIKNQAELANKYGIFGFCIYHYWFNGHLLLHRPMELLLEHKEIDIHYCISWANEDWTNAWVKNDKKVLIQHDYSKKEDITDHFNYLLPFFKDPRYIQIDHKPLFVIYRPELIPNLSEFVKTFNTLAQKNGFSGIVFASQQYQCLTINKIDRRLFDYHIEYQPDFVNFFSKSFIWRVSYKFFKKYMKYKFVDNMRKSETLKLIDYDDAWKRILKFGPINKNALPGAFVNWDNTPRHKGNGTVYTNFSPQKFKKYLCQQIIRAKKDYKTDYLFLFAWNEWGEGGYIEPDEKYRYQYLEAVQNALMLAERILS